MTRANKALVVMVTAALGLWGCAQGPANSASASLERIKALEGKCSKLEDDYRAVASARDQLRKKLAAAEEDRGRTQQELNKRQGIMKERDELKQQLSSRTTERDAVQGQFELFRKSIKTLLGQAEASITAAPAGERSVANQ
jgi:chromosome segregation ATPase